MDKQKTKKDKKTFDFYIFSVVSLHRYKSAYKNREIA
tara:strand:- start:109 stop:219 length:111 start_codon:yes stop_codon:yes gene_type:complete